MFQPGDIVKLKESRLLVCDTISTLRWFYKDKILIVLSFKKPDDKNYPLSLNFQNGWGYHTFYEKNFSFYFEKIG